MNRRTLVNSALASMMALGMAAGSGTAAAAEGEKCYGVAAAGKNDCQTATSACAGTSKHDNAGDAFIFVPKGTCAKIAGGSLEPMMGGMMKEKM